MPSDLWQKVIGIGLAVIVGVSVKWMPEALQGPAIFAAGALFALPFNLPKGTK